MDNTTALWNVLLWGFGICASGFFVLLGMVIKVSKEVAKPLQEIRDALLGTLVPSKPGLVSQFFALKKDLEEFKVDCNLRHSTQTRHNE